MKKNIRLWVNIGSCIILISAICILITPKTPAATIEEDNQIISIGRYYERFGAGYENSKIACINLDTPITSSVRFLIHLVFPEIKVYLEHRRAQFGRYANKDKERWYKRDAFVILPDIGELKKRLQQFLDEVDKAPKKAQDDDIELKLISQTLKAVAIISGYYEFDEEIDFDEEVRRLRTGKNDANKKSLAELNKINEEKITNPKQLSLIYLIKGWIYCDLKQYRQSIEMYDKVINWEIGDYAIAASFYKAISVGLLFGQRDHNIRASYSNLLSKLRSETWSQEGMFESLTRSQKAKEVWLDTLKRYPNLETDRRVVFIWIKEILAGKPFPESNNSQQPEVIPPAQGADKKPDTPSPVPPK